MVKIKNVKIKGLRGIRKEINLPLYGKSILLYGENGSGKSSITDAVEWFYCYKIGHLSSEEIGRKGIEGLRNIFLGDSEDGFLLMEYTKSILDSSKIITFFNLKLTTKYSNNSSEFITYLNESQKEQIILRYRDLVSFILSPKGEKLKTLSEIIGFSEVIKTRDTLRKTLSLLKKEIKNSNFDTQINYQQSQLIEQLEENIVSDKQYLNKINNLIKPIGLKKSVTKFDDLESILELLKKPEDTKLVEQQVFLNKVKGIVNQLISLIKNIKTQYKNYFKKYTNIVTDIEKLNKIKLETLLTEGERVLKEEIIKDEICPLCLQPKNKLELLEELQERLEELSKYKNEKTDLEETRLALQNDISKAKNIIDNIFLESQINLEQYKILKNTFEKIKDKLNKYDSETRRDLYIEKKLKLSSELIFNKKIFELINNFLSQKIKELKKSREGDLKFDIHSKIVLSKNAYLNIKKLKKSKALLEQQQYTLEKIYTAFIKKMENGLKSFLFHLSKDINDLYIFMNPGEHIENINLIPLQKNDEFLGVTIQFKFYENEVFPPNKYLSESHLNCLGLAFFLTSVKAFNKINKFFILDDVISSFDTQHRIRFAHLVTEKFSDYQIILMTHEKDWFDYVSKIVKGKNWHINRFRFEEKTVPTIDMPIPSLKERIENQIRKNDIEGLGNNIRKYLEGFLKELALNFEIPVKFLFNDKNENRMSNELLTALKGHIKKHVKTQINISSIDRLLGTQLIGHKESHDSSFKVSIGDCKAFWSDVVELRDLFYCKICKKYISKKYYDPVNKKIRCSCSNIEYEWK